MYFKDTVPHCKKRLGDFVLSLKGFVATSITESILSLKGQTNEMDFSMFRYKSVRQPVHDCCSLIDFGFEFVEIFIIGQNRLNEADSRRLRISLIGGIIV
jgi:hypothetical protein